MRTLSFCRIEIVTILTVCLEPCSIAGGISVFGVVSCLSDSRRVSPERLRTILRQPVREVLI